MCDVQPTVYLTFLAGTALRASRKVYSKQNVADIIDVN